MNEVARRLVRGCSPVNTSAAKIRLYDCRYSTITLVIPGPLSYICSFPLMAPMQRISGSARTASRGTRLAPRGAVDEVWARVAIRVVLVMSSLALVGCASTRFAEVGAVGNGERLVTLVVSEDRQVVHQECRDVPALGPVLGCQKSRSIALPNGVEVRAVK